MIIYLIYQKSYTYMTVFTVFPFPMFLYMSAFLLLFKSQIVGLYKDPGGKNITTFTEKDNATVDNNTTSGSDMKELKRRVVELETSLKQYVRE